MAEKIELMTIEVPEHLARAIRKQIEEGKFGSESEAIVASLRQTDEFSWLPNAPIDGLTDDEWEAEMRCRIEENEQSKTKFFTLDEVRASLAACKDERDAA